MNMKKVSVAVLSALTLAAGAVEVDGVVATVGKKSILRSDVLAVMGSATDPARFNEVRDSLIERELILRAAEAAKVSIQDWVVKDRVRQLVEERFGGDRNRLNEALAREKRTYADWERSEKESLIIQAMCWNAVTKNVRVTPSELQVEFADHPERYRAGGLATVSIILLKPEDGGKREEVLDLVRAESFAAAARKYSADTHAKDGGLWKDVRPEEVFKPEICDEINRLAAGETSAWIDLGGWSFLLRKDAETAARTRSFAEAYDEIKATVQREKLKRAHKEWVDRLKADAYIRIY